jgi:hypothetical protein
MKVKNVPKHALYAYVAASVANTTMQLINMIPKTEFHLGWFLVVAWAMITLNWERNQYLSSKLSLSKYFKIKWLDTLIDVIVGNAVFILVLYLAGWLNG